MLCVNVNVIVNVKVCDVDVGMFCVCVFEVMFESVCDVVVMMFDGVIVFVEVLIVNLCDVSDVWVREMKEYECESVCEVFVVIVCCLMLIGKVDVFR